MAQVLSGYNFDPQNADDLKKSWYGAGFIDFMTRGPKNGDFVFAHRMRNPNVNTEAFMRTGNQPSRSYVMKLQTKVPSGS